MQLLEAITALADLIGKRKTNIRTHIKVGDYRLFSVAPGWLFVGRVDSQDECCLILNPAVWIESPGEPITTAILKPLNGSHVFHGGFAISQDAIIGDCPASPNSIARLVTKPISDAV